MRTKNEERERERKGGEEGREPKTSIRASVMDGKRVRGKEDVRSEGRIS